MENYVLEEKSSFARKFVPAVKPKFVDVDFIDCKSVKDDKIVFKCKNKTVPNNIFAYICLFIVTIVMIFSSCKLLLSNSKILGINLYDVVVNVFAPKDFGKIKFVDNENYEKEKEALGSVCDLGVPFVACFSTKIDDVFLLSSPSEVTVKCAMDGVVENIYTDDKTLKKTIIVKHKMDIRSQYLLLDNVSVVVGDSVNKNTILGLSYSGNIGFKVSYKNSIVKGLEIIDGQLSFT